MKSYFLFPFKETPYSVKLLVFSLKTCPGQPIGSAELDNLFFSFLENLLDPTHNDDGLQSFLFDGVIPDTFI